MHIQIFRNFWERMQLAIFNCLIQRALFFICYFTSLLHCPLLPVNNLMNMNNWKTQHLILNSTDFHTGLTLNWTLNPAHESNLWMMLTIFLFAAERVKDLENANISSFSSSCKQKLFLRYQFSKHD